MESSHGVFARAGSYLSALSIADLRGCLAVVANEHAAHASAPLAQKLLCAFPQRATPASRAVHLLASGWAESLKAVR